MCVCVFLSSFSEKKEETRQRKRRKKGRKKSDKKQHDHDDVKGQEWKKRGWVVVANRRTNLWIFCEGAKEMEGELRGCILGLVNGGGRFHLQPNRSHRSVAL